MFKRLAMLALAALCCGGSGGCMLMDAVVDTHDRWATCYRARHWMGCQCGELYWSEWFNDPPDCCDTCNQCGQFVGPQCCRRSVPNYQRGFLYALSQSRQTCSPFYGPSPCLPADPHACPSYPYYRAAADGAGPYGAPPPPPPSFGDDGPPDGAIDGPPDGPGSNGEILDDTPPPRVSKRPRVRS